MSVIILKYLCFEGELSRIDDFQLTLIVINDNDEWQGSDDSGDNEIGMSGDDEDSVVESLTYHDDTGYIQNREDFNVYEKEEACKNEKAEFVCGRGITSEASSGKLLNSSSSNLSSQV